VKYKQQTEGHIDNTIILENEKISKVMAGLHSIISEMAGFRG
jgi:hypothetical protein